LKSLSIETESIKAATTGNDVGPDGKPMDKQSEEIKAIMKRYSDIIGDLQVLYFLTVFLNTNGYVSYCLIMLQYTNMRFRR